MSDMKLTTVQTLTLASPGIAVLFALSFLAMSRFHHAARYLKLLAASFLLFALAASGQILGIPSDAGGNAVISGALYVGCVILLAEGVLRRTNLTLGRVVPPVALIGIVGGLAYLYYGDRNLVARVYLLNFGCAAVLLAAAMRMTPLLRSKTTDRVVFWAFLAFALSFFPRTWLTLGQVRRGMSTHAFGTSSFWIALQMWLVLSGVALAIILIFAATADKIDDLRRERNEDHLTGLLNRRGFDESSKLRGRRVSDTPSSLIACDVDHFKRINDTFGHTAGDAVLRHVARLLRSVLRSGDEAGRVGGEEFLVLLPGTGSVDACEIAQRMRETIATAHFPGLPADYRVTASFGVATRQPGESMDALVMRVDRLLYDAKDAERNRVAIDGPRQAA